MGASSASLSRHVPQSRQGTHAGDWPARQQMVSGTGCRAVPMGVQLEKGEWGVEL